MRFRINIDNPVSLRDAPLPDAPASAGTVDGTDLLEKIADAGDLWWQVKVVTPGASEQRKGFVRSNLLTEVERTDAEEIDQRALFSSDRRRGRAALCKPRLSFCHCFRCGRLRE